MIYDISDNKRRRKICKVLDSFGIRIQESAYECYISVYKINKLVNGLRRFSDSEEDKIRIYQLNDNNVIHTIGSYKGPSRSRFELI